MKRIKTKEMMIYLIGLAMCNVNIAGCYPIVLSYFTAMYMEMNKRLLTLVLTYLGMVIFLPVTQLGRYGIAVVVTAIMIGLLEWMNKHCRIQTSAVLAGVVITVISLSGCLLTISNKTQIVSYVLEGLFTYGMIVILSHLMYLLLRERPVAVHKEKKNERLQNYAESFNGLSKIFLSMQAPALQDKEKSLVDIQEEITGKICASCNLCQVCWEQDSPIHSLLANLIQSMQEYGQAKKEYEKNLKDYCPQADEITKEAVRIFERTKVNMAWYQRLLENRELIAQQLDAMAFVMEDCAIEYEDITKQEKMMLNRVKYHARDRGYLITDIRLYRKQNGRLQLVTTVHTKNGCLPIKEYREAICKGMDMLMMQHKDSRNMIGREKQVVIFEEDTAFHVIRGMARLTKDGEGVSGDNFSFLELENGQYVMCLSDGMGSGMEACRESEMVIELVEKFMEAGFTKETAISMMNSAMVIRGDNEVFSTIDIAAIDLYSGIAEFYKVGAAATFIKRKSGVECLLSSGLPVGASHRMELAGIKKELKDGDFLVMVSDGVLEYLHVKEPEATMGDVIASLDTNNPTKLAKGILERVLLYTGGEVKDDMTVLAVSIWEK